MNDCERVLEMLEAMLRLERNKAIDECTHVLAVLSYDSHPSSSLELLGFADRVVEGMERLKVKQANKPAAFSGLSVAP